MKPICSKKGVKLQSTADIELHEAQTWSNFQTKENTNVKSSYFRTHNEIYKPKYTKVSPVRNNGIEYKSNNRCLNSTFKVWKFARALQWIPNVSISICEKTTLLNARQEKQCDIFIYFIINYILNIADWRVRPSKPINASLCSRHLYPSQRFVRINHRSESWS